MVYLLGFQLVVMVMKVLGKEFYFCFILYFFFYFRGELFFFRDIERFYKKLKFDKEIRLVIVMVSEVYGFLVF